MAEVELSISVLFSLETMEEILDLLENVERKKYNMRCQYLRACENDLDYRILNENEQKIRMAIAKKVNS